MKHRALVVDDGPVERLLGKTLLEQLDFHVTAVDSGGEALRWLEAGGVDLVVCDISMPDMNGLDVLERGCAQPDPPAFIMATNLDDAEHAVASLQRGAYGYLTKPLRLEALREAVREALTRRERERQAALDTRRLATEDALTGTLNRPEFSRLLGQLLEQNRGDGILLMLKVRDLNFVNHSFGPAEGDKVLQHAAQILQRRIRGDDLLCRFGGDVFAVFLRDIPAAQLDETARRLMQQIEAAKLVVGGDAFVLALTVGGAASQPGMNAEDWIQRADFALHLARQDARKHYHVYSDADQAHKAELSHQLANLALVRRALDRKAFTMHYQPIVDLHSGAVTHYEALLRVSDENGIVRPAGELVKTCEVFDLIGRLDRAVVEACLEDMVTMQSEVSVAINLSGKSIGDPALLSFIEARIEALGINPERLIFELTETAAFGNMEEVRNFVGWLKALGGRFALDDFGVGFSSFYYIKELNFDYLKIDGSFIKHLTHSPNDQVFVRAMVEISRVFDMQVIAEWVEDEATAALLREYGVTLGQGYYFGKPAPLKA